jgi:phosphate transport system substrate-binding protein
MLLTLVGWPVQASDIRNFHIGGTSVLFKRLAAATSAAVFVGCAVGISSAAAATTLNGAGSTLIAPLEAEWGSAWGGSNGVTVSYNAVGSGTGYKDIAQGLVDFGASDAPLSAYSSPACNNCVQIPWGLSATGVSYRIDGISLPRGKALHLTPSIISGIYLGQIKNWDDPSITKINKGAHIPSTPISVFWRNDASGDSFAFTSELSDTSSTFHSQVGASTQPSFPVGVGEKGNGGMASALSQTNGGIAYISVAYLLANQLPAAAVQNRHGTFAVPNLGAIENAASVVHSVPSDNQVTIVNPPKKAKSAYPISTFTYAIVPTNAPQGALLRAFITFALSGSGQSYGPRLGFAPMPKDVLRAARGTVSRIQ